MNIEVGADGLAEALRAGDHDAAAALVERFTCRLIALARSRLGAVIGQQVDPEDVVQSVYKSFLKRLRDGDCDFENWDDLWPYLALLTVRKCSDRRHYHRAARRDVAREEPLMPTDDFGRVLELMAHEPTPFEAASLSELVERFLDERKPRDRDILQLHLQGFTIGEISERLDRAERTVRRTIAKAKHRLLEGVLAGEEIGDAR